jgi:hypothetical protein
MLRVINPHARRRQHARLIRGIVQKKKLVPGLIDSFLSAGYLNRARQPARPG